MAENIKIPIEYDYKDSAKKAAKDINNILDKDVKVDIKADTSQAEKSISKVKSDVKGISDKKIEIKADTSQVEKSVSKVKSDLKGISDQKIKIDADASGAEKGIKGLMSKFSGLKDSAGNAFEGITGKLGGLGGGIGETIGKLGEMGKAAGVAAAAIAAAFAAIELGTFLDGINTQIAAIKNLGNVTSEEASRIQASIKAVSDVFGTDYKENVDAVRSVTKILGGDLEENAALIEKGYLAGADNSGEFLSILKEYPAAIKQSGIELEDFIALSALQSQQGVFSDRGIDAIKEAGISLREQTQATKDALNNAFGREFTDKILNGIKSGAIGTLDAIKQIAPRLKDLDNKARETVIADVFRGAGEDALPFIQSISDANLNLDNLIENQGKLAERQKGQIELQKSFNNAINNLAQKLEPIIDFFVELGTQIAIAGADFLGFLIDAVEYASPIVYLIKGIIASLDFLITTIKNVVVAGAEWLDSTLGLTKAYDAVIDAIKETIGFVTDLVNTVKDSANDVLSYFGIVDSEQEQLAKTAEQSILNIVDANAKLVIGLANQRNAVNEAGGSWANLASTFVSGILKPFENFKPDKPKPSKTVISTWERASEAVENYTESVRKASGQVEKLGAEQTEIVAIEKQTEKLKKELEKQRKAKSLTESQFKELSTKAEEEAQIAILLIRAKYNKLQQAELYTQYRDEIDSLRQIPVPEIKIGVEIDNFNATKTAFSALTEFSKGLITDFTEFNQEKAKERNDANNEALKTDLSDLSKSLALQEISLEEYQKREQDLKAEAKEKELANADEQTNAIIKLQETLQNAFKASTNVYSQELDKILEMTAESSENIGELFDNIYDNAESVFSALGGVIASRLGEAFSDGILTLEEFNKAVLGSILETTQKAILVYIPEIMAKSISLLGPIVGIPVGIAAIATVQALLAAAKGGIGAETGRLPGIKEAGKKGASDTELMWVNPNEAILTEQMTNDNQKFLRHLFNGGNEDNYFKDRNYTAITNSHNAMSDIALNNLNKTTNRLNDTLLKGIQVDSNVKLDIRKEKGIKVFNKHLSLR